MNKKQSTLQTRKNLVQAFWEIYRDKNIRDMTIAEVAQKAGYNRRTFYRHFKSLDEVLQSLEEEVSTMNYPHHDPDAYKDVVESVDFNDFFRSVQYKGEYICKFIGPDGDPNYIAKTVDSLIPLFGRTFASPENDGLRDYALAYLVGGSLTVFRLWHDRDKDIPDQAMMLLFALLHRRGPLSVLNPSADPALREELREIRDCMVTQE